MRNLKLTAWASKFSDFEHLISERLANYWVWQWDIREWPLRESDGQNENKLLALCWLSRYFVTRYRVSDVNLAYKNVS